MEEDVVCPFGVEDQKLLLYDDFSCWDEGEYKGKASKEAIANMPKSNEEFVEKMRKCIAIVRTIVYNIDEEKAR